MRSIVPLLGLICGSIGSLAAAPLCAPGDLSMYIGLGSTGCDVGSATFSGFQTLPVITGAQAIAAGDVTISPFQSGDVVGLDVQFSETANSGQLLQALIGYTVAGPLFIGNSIAVSGSSATGGGFVTDIQNSCRGGSYLPGVVSGCTGVDVTLLVLNSGMDQRTFSAVSTIGIVHDYTLDAGATGSASGGMVSDRFSLQPSQVVPEPSTYALMASGLAAALAFRRRKSV